MYVNSVRNYNIQSFRGEEAEVKQPAETLQTQASAETQPAAAKAAAENDRFEQTSQSAVQNPDMMPRMQMPSLAQITKMKTTQKVMGASVFAVGALGILSALSPKKWVRLLFTIPVGGIIAYFGANMYNMANAYDKLKDLSIYPPKQ